jgi:hypothetical protein
VSHQTQHLTSTALLTKAAVWHAYCLFTFEVDLERKTIEMTITKAKVILLAGIGILGGMVQRAIADEWDQRTTFTFSSPEHFLIEE